MILVQNLSYSRQGRIILPGLSFNVGQGAGLMVTGPNGSGKTTLLRLLAGLLEPDSGEIALSGEIFYLAHKNAMKDEMTALENLAFWAGLAGNEILIPAAISYFGLEDFAEMPYRNLSQGLQRRVALARLMFARQKIWLLDEPFANIDQETAERLKNLIIIRVEQGGAVIFSSHQRVDLRGFQELELCS